MPKDARWRELDLVVFGATGFTGRLIAAYLAAKGQTRWGLAGRDYDRLRGLRADLTNIDPSAAQADIITARVEDAGSLAAMAERARVVITTVGPYARYGEPVVAACVEAGTDYLDLTGEPSWWSRVVSRYHDRAVEKGALLVPSCGFESVPADLGAAFTVDCLAGGVPEGGAIDLDAYVTFRGDISGGTWRTVLDELGRVSARGWPGRGRSGQSPLERHREAGGRGPHFAESVGHWVAPLPSVEPLVVARSQQLLAATDQRRPLVRYRQYLQSRSAIELAAVGTGAGILTTATQIPGVRRVLADIRGPRSGPDAQQRARSWFRLRFEGSDGQRRVVTQVRGGDPGYGETAKIISEAARLMVSDRERLPGAAGVLTPSTAFGWLLRERLDDVGVTFRVLEREAA